jgi:hypothetical protein
MAATDQHYRNQKWLDALFGVTCILMLLSILGMFAQDFYREFKVEQRGFRDVEFAVAERDMLDALPHAELQALVEADKALKQARQSRDESLTASAQEERDKALAGLDEYIGRLAKLDGEVKKAKENVAAKKKEGGSRSMRSRSRRPRSIRYSRTSRPVSTRSSLYYIAVDSRDRTTRPLSDSRTTWTGSANSSTRRRSSRNRTEPS